MKPKIGILSLGCPRNLVDSESISGRLSEKGYEIVDIDKAQVAIVNTCAFIDEAKKESIEAILELVDLKKKGKLRKVIVYGCLSQRYKGLLSKELPEVDAFVGRIALDYGISRFSITPKHYAYLKICEGCVNHCSFCVIPEIKGRFQSLSPLKIIDKAVQFSGQGISELNIVGQDITGYGIDLKDKNGLAGLIEEIVEKAKHINWFRLLYLNPARIDDRLLKLIAAEKRICKYVDLPIQHINNRILKFMNRRITRDSVIRTIERIRGIVPGVALRTSVIVGFPGETEKEFSELLKFVKDVKFERLGAFKYSREEGTKAYNFKGQVPEEIKRERFNQIMLAQQEVSREVNSRFIGKTLKVLVDEGKAGDYIGRTEFDAPEVDGLVYIKSKRKLSPGDFVNLKVTDTLEYDLVGEEKE